MYRNWSNLGRFARRSLLAANDSPYRLTAKRAGLLAAFCALYGCIEIATDLGWRLDDLLAPGYRAEKVEAPVFIIGNPRSGTTLLHRLLAQDTGTFTTMRLLEILFAPTVTQQRLLRALCSLDGRLGSPCRHIVEHLDARADRGNVLHSARLLAPEEDQFVMLHPWAGLGVWHISGMLEEAGPYTHFDTAVPEAEQARIMAFYTGAVRRHVHAHRRQGGESRHYLAKNPAASPKVAALCKAFPDARFVTLVRNPLQMIPSMISTLDMTWRILGSPPRRYAGRDYVLEMARHWYSYPLEKLADLPADRRAIVTFDRLAHAADEVVLDLYQRFGLSASPVFRHTVAREAAAARSYTSNHVYDLDEMGLSRERILDAFADVFDRFGFAKDIC